jgi:beta-carotene isomerase
MGASLASDLGIRGLSQENQGLIHFEGSKWFMKKTTFHMGCKTNIQSMFLKSPKKSSYIFSKDSKKNVPKRQKTKYDDSWIDTMVIDYLCKCLQVTTGKNTNLGGYNGLVDVVSKTFGSFNTIRQRQLILDALLLAIPMFFLNFVRVILKPSKFTSERFAASTPFLFQWLVGPCEVTEIEINGVNQQSMVHIKKCRVLESTNCAGICINMCKIPCQQFIKQYLGTSATLTPNFEDMSCSMVFGKDPPPIKEDPAMTQACYGLLCNIKEKDTKNMKEKDSKDY